MYYVSLEKARFFVHLGMYTQEQSLQNELEVSVRLGFEANINQLPFVDYSSLYSHVAEGVNAGRETLESILQLLIIKFSSMEEINSIEVQIAKKNPALLGHVAAARVAWEWKK